MLTVDDRDGQIGLDNATEVEAAGGSLLSVDEDHVDVLFLSPERNLSADVGLPQEATAKRGVASDT